MSPMREKLLDPTAATQASVTFWRSASSLIQAISGISSRILCTLLVGDFDALAAQLDGDRLRHLLYSIVLEERQSAAMRGSHSAICGQIDRITIISSMVITNGDAPMITSSILPRLRRPCTT